MDLSLLKNKPAGPLAGGGINKVYFALADDILTFPDRDAGNKAVISSDVVFKTGKGWNLLYTTKFKQKLVENGNDLRDNDAYTSVFTAYHPGLKETLRQFISEHGSDEMYLLVYDCAESYPILIGRKCCPCTMKADVDSGEGIDSESGNTLTFTSMGPYLSAHYKGVFESSDGVIAADDTSPDVSTGTSFITSANSGPTEIIDLDNAVPGSTITISGGSNTNSSTISDGGNFSLTGPMTLSVGSFISLYVRGPHDFVELARG